MHSNTKARSFLTLCLFVGIVIGYVFSRRPNVWWNAESVGIALNRGTFQSFQIRFCDACFGVYQTNGDGTGRLVWKPAVMTTNGFEFRRHRWPKFHYTRYDHYSGL